MYLKALTLKGFKSFADKTDLNFETGVTVVVGPNGSGKSNLVDAVAWVLGAQGARALRGAKMDDVIFAGTTKKPALGRAEVSLTIDNSDSTLPIEFTEVTITRTLFRSGESEYRLNNVPCRLLDIQELLSDSRIGRTQHVIVGQGQLDSVLNARPEDRRAIIEEAAGVLKYRKRREKSQRRLEATEGNLARLGDLVREVRRQLTPLERQADAAKRHDGVRDELKSIQLFLAGQEIRGLQSSLERVNEERIEYKEREQLLISQLSELDLKVIDAEAALMKVGDSDVSQWLTRAERLVSRTSATKAMLHERKRSISALMDASADESVIESLLAEKQELENTISNLNSNLKTLLPQANELKERCEIADGQYQELLDDEPSGDIQNTFESTNKEHQARLDSLNTMKSRIEADSVRLKSVEHRLTVLQQDHQDAVELLETDSGFMKELKSENEIVAQNLSGITSEVNELEQLFAALQSDTAKAKAQYELMVETFNDSKQEAGIENVRSVQGVLGTLLENISIQEKAQEACSVVLSDLANSIVVDSPQSAKQAMASLSNSDISARLFVLGAAFQDKKGYVPDGAVPITRYISSPSSRIEQALHTALSNVVFVDGDWKSACDIALSNPDLIVVSKDGDRFGGLGAWSLGKNTARAITSTDIDNASRNSENQQRALGEYAQKKEQAVAKKVELENKERELATQIAEVNSRCEIARQTVHTTESAMRARGEEKSSLESEIAKLENDIRATQIQLVELKERLSQLEEHKDNEAQFIEVFKTKKLELASTREVARRELRHKEIEVETSQVRLQDAKQRLNTTLIRLAKDPEQERIAIARRQALSTQQNAIDNLIERVRAVESSATHARDILNNEREKQNREAHQSTAVLESLRVERKQSEKTLIEIREHLQKGDIRQAESKTRLANTVEQLRNFHDCEPEFAIDAPMPELAEGVRLASRARELERELKIMGPINPLAIQEYEELNERYAFLTEQLDDVKSSRKELHKVIKSIDQEIVTVFEKAFEDVQKHFSDLFSTLFSGGAGRLTLTDPNDMLNTGIEMEARPSGKNVRRLSLLSGGERSLTALAFLFAVFRSRPSPFYIMDEVEAALDEPNLMRFLDLVAEFRNDAQLLIVSHQKKTMEASDELYGVSMAPGGTSRVVKQRIEKKSPVFADAPVSIDLVSEHDKDNNSEIEEDSILESSI